MSKYLARLKALEPEKPLPEQPSKPSKGAFEPFDGCQGRAFSRDEMASPVSSPKSSAAAAPQPVLPLVASEAVTMAIPAGLDPFERAAEVIRLAQERGKPRRRYLFSLTRDGEPGRDPRCRCGELATFARFDRKARDGRRWYCRACFDIAADAILDAVGESRA